MSLDLLGVALRADGTRDPGAAGTSVPPAAACHGRSGPATRQSPVSTSLVALWMLGCAAPGGEAAGPAATPNALEPPPRIEAVVPVSLLPGTPVEVRGEGFRSPGGRGRIVIEGDFGWEGVSRIARVSFSVQAHLAPDGSVARFAVDRQVLAALPASEGWFQGTVTAEVPGDGGEVRRAMAPWAFTLKAVPVVRLVGFAAGKGEAFLAERLPVEGDGLLFPGEGTSELVFRGTFQVDAGAPVEGTFRARVEAAYPDRSVGHFTVEPYLFGVRPGFFRGTVSLVGRLPEGREVPAAPLALDRFALSPPMVFRLDPPVASRGRKVVVEGGGFLPFDARRQTATYFLLDGTFTSRTGEVRRVAGQEVPAEMIESHDRAVVAFRSAGPVAALTASPGSFEGTLTPVVTWRDETVAGVPFTGGIRVTSPLQVVYLKYLPSFSDSLRNVFGLRNVEREVRDRVLEVCERYYEGINMRFQEVRPTDFVEYAVIEVGGPDPNGAGLFGLDNTEGKDIGNLRLDDWIGGRNAGSEEQGFYAFGGVFVESFRGFSPRWIEPLPIASPVFDRIFGPLAPFLGGEPVEVDEYPGGPRAPVIEEAIRVFGNLVGETIVHEIGHSLGLSMAVPEHEFHNYGRNGYVMDAGAERSFEQRGEVDGVPPATWHPVNWDYLEHILPVE